MAYYVLDEFNGEYIEEYSKRQKLMEKYWGHGPLDNYIDDLWRQEKLKK